MRRKQYSKYGTFIPHCSELPRFLRKTYGCPLCDLRTVASAVMFFCVLSLSSSLLVVSTEVAPSTQFVPVLVLPDAGFRPDVVGRVWLIKNNEGLNLDIDPQKIILPPASRIVFVLPEACPLRTTLLDTFSFDQECSADLAIA